MSGTGWHPGLDNHNPPRMKEKNTMAGNGKRDMMKVVEGLLTKAADPAVSAEESQALTAKAAQLMDKYNLDAATLRADKGQRPESISMLQFEVSGQGWHGKGRAALVCHVAEAFGTRVCTVNNLMNGETRWVNIVGPKSTLDALETLLPSIVMQAESRGMVAKRLHINEVRHQFGSAQEINREGRTFFRSYLPQFGLGVADKIAASREKLEKEVKGTTGALVLASQAERVAAEFAKRFPDLKPVQADNFNAAGAVAGRRDGRTADTGQTRVESKRKSVTGKK